MGPLIFDFSAAGARVEQWKHEWERTYVEAALAATGGNLTRAARLLGIHRTTLYSRMQNYGADVAQK